MLGNALCVFAQFRKAQWFTPHPDASRPTSPTRGEVTCRPRRLTSPLMGEVAARRAAGEGGSADVKESN
jgi:hypothetical protein